MKTKNIMDSVVADFNSIVNDGFTARHDVLARESSIETAQLNQDLGIASADDYRARYIALLACVVEYVDMQESEFSSLAEDIRYELDLVSQMIDDFK